MHDTLPARPISEPHPDGTEEDLFLYTSGPRNAKVVLVGEAWGSEEAAARKPFVGASGQELDRILFDAGIPRSSVLCTNLISARPAGNDFTEFLYPSTEKGISSVRGIKAKPALVDGLAKLEQLLHAVKPKLVLVAGNWPLWALTEEGAASISTTAGFRTPKGITKWRGSQLWSRSFTASQGGESRDPKSVLPSTSTAKNSLRSPSPTTEHRYPVLPIIHPAAILRDYAFRNITVHDLRSRAKRFLSGELSWDASNKTFTLWKPTWEQIEQRLHRWKQDLQKGELWLAVDLETWKRKWISVVGIADAYTELCVPLFKAEGGKVTNYLDVAKEQILFEELKLILEHPNVRITGQNFIYDTEWLHRLYNIEAIVSFDTMVAHHLLFPGTPKRLDYLASLYCEYFSYWKDESWDLDGDIGEHTWKYNCKDLRATYEIGEVLRSVIAQQGMEALYSFQIEQWQLSRKMALRGVNFDSTLQKGMRLALLEEASNLSTWLLNAVPEALQYTSTGTPWYASPTGTARLLYQVLGLSPVLHKKTKRPTTDDEALQALSERREAKWLSPLFERLRHLRSLGVFTSNFLDARCSADGRMRCSFNIAHPETFRWSSNSNGFGEGTNLQNIPKGEE